MTIILIALLIVTIILLFFLSQQLMSLTQMNEQKLEKIRETLEKNLRLALEELAGLEVVQSAPCLIRIVEE